MNGSMTLRRVLLAPPNLRRTSFPRTFLQALSLQYSTSIPSVAQPSFWTSLIPKPLRKSSSRSAVGKKPRSKEWNPATFFIFIFLLIGSMSIQMIALRNEFATFTRRADAKIGLLKEIIERIQKGEEVDVESLLGTGNVQKEKEWEEVLQEIEQDEAWEHSHQTPKHGQNHNDSRAVEPQGVTTTEEAGKQPPTTKTKINAPPSYY